MKRYAAKRDDKRKYFLILNHDEHLLLDKNVRRSC